MDATVKLLMNYYGRDKIMRTVTYASMLVAGTAKGQLAQRAGTLATQISAARTVLRMFDDPLMYKYITTYGWGKQERDPVYRVLQIINNLADTLFFPLEHLAWLGQHKLIPVAYEGWMVSCIAMWAFSLFTGIIRCLRRLCITSYKIKSLVRKKKLESPERSDPSIGDEIKALRSQQASDVLTIIKNGADLLNAVNWLPKGFLWATKFSTAYSGVFGLVSSLVGFYQLLASAAKAKAS